MAHVARLVVGLSLAAAFPARLLHLLHESGGKLHTLENDAAALAHRARVDMLGIIGTRAMAVLAELLAVDAEVHFAAIVQVLQRYGHGGLHVLVSLLSAKAAKAEDIGEGVEALLASLLFSLLHALFALHIIYSSFVFVGQAVVRRLDINELGFALVGLALIGVVLQTQLSVCSLDLRLGSLSSHLLPPPLCYLSMPKIL